MTPVEDLVWASVFAAYWTARREAQRKYGGDRSDLDMAGEAAAQADRAIAALEAALSQDAVPREIHDQQPTEAT